jgi:hypothetical protein
VLGTYPRCRQPERHVGVLGIGQDKIAAGRIGKDSGKLFVQRFSHEGLSGDETLFILQQYPSDENQVLWEKSTNRTRL